MTLTFREVDQIMRIVEEFPADEVRFEYGDLKLHVRRDGAAGRVASATQTLTPATTQTAAAAQASATPVTQQPAVAASSAALASTATTVASPTQRDGLVPVIAPMMGVFYAAPAPDAPPFVAVGQQVNEGTDLCIIEVMKVMNTIKSPCAGRVVEIAASNGNMVERSSAIFWIEPAR